MVRVMHPLRKSVVVMTGFDIVSARPVSDSLGIPKFVPGDFVLLEVGGRPYRVAHWAAAKDVVTLERMALVEVWWRRLCARLRRR